MPVFKKLHEYRKTNGSDYYFVLNQESEVIFKSLHLQKCLDKKARLDFIARARNTYTPNKFRIINLKNSSAMQTRNEHER